MKDFYSIIVKLKIFIANGEKKKVMDKEVAMLLGISQSQLATLKRRNSIPYREILLFCREENICCTTIFFD